ncbi:MAG TPA: agmatine deiminase family protein [Kofleriaceae bacterium]|nr:agmatine deiminase family protein [Kofleriaceae bacterium]
MKRAKDQGFHQPAEWADHDAVWTAWPHIAEEWAQGLDGPRRSLARMIEAIVALDDGGRRRGERVDLLVPDAATETAARALIGAASSGVRFHQAHYGDVWLRDTAPVFVVDDAGGLAAACFEFNGWGGKYVMPGDTHVAPWIAGATGAPAWPQGFILEGGAIEVDGEGTVLTTRQCLLGGNRNPGLDEAGMTELLCASLGAEHVIWLDRGLANDHTDGHIDTLARFVAPGVVTAMAPAPDDPNKDALEGIISDLRAAKDARGRRLEVVTVPSPGGVLDHCDTLMPASYMNFYIGNHAVVVPTYRAGSDDAAVAAVAKMFPGRAAVGVDCYPVLVGGGGFHCTTQQQPSRAGAKTP